MGKIFPPSSDSGSASGEGAAHLAALSLIVEQQHANLPELGWKIADREEQFARLIYALTGAEISSKTAQAAFDDASDSAALAAVGLSPEDLTANATISTLYDMLNGSDYLASLIAASSEMLDYQRPDLENAVWSTLGTPQAAKDNSQYSLTFSSDGTSFLYMPLDTREVHKAMLGTAWDASTVSGTDAQTFDPTQFGFPECATWSEDGTKLYVCDTNEIAEYNLSAAFDISSPTHVATTPIPTGYSVIRGISFSTDGTKMILSMFSDGDIYDSGVYRFELGTPWVVSTYTDPGGDGYLGQGRDGPLHFSASGRLAVNSGPDRVRLHSFSSPFDLSTGTEIAQTPNNGAFGSTNAAYLAESEKKVFLLDRVGNKLGHATYDVAFY